MATLMGLGLRAPDFAPFDLAQSRKESMANQTSLIALEELKRQQQTEALVRQRLQQDPGLLLNPGGPQSTLASPALTQPPGGPQALQRGAGVSPQGGGPIPPDVAAQVMPTVTPPGGPPQSTLAGLAPQPRQNPLEALIRENPEAGLKIMQMQQAQQDRQWKLQEQELDRREKVTGYLAKQLQGVTDQETLDGLRQDLQRGGMSQYAAALPQFYSKEAIAPLITRAQTALENATTAKAIADARKATQQAQTEQYNREVFLPQVLSEDQAPRGGAPPPGTNGTAAPGRQVSAPAEVETAVQEATRLYPQVRPALVRAIIAQESNFDARAVSKKGAKGLMQLMDGTAKDMGVDDPFDTTQNVRGGVRYFAQLLTKYGGDEAKALAAYNAGPGAVDKAGGDLKALPQETQDYVPKVLQRAQVGETARGPATGPQVQRLEAKIADLTRKRDLAAKASVVNPGMNTYADNLTKQIDELRKDRDRLEEIPRAVEKEKALQPLKVEQAQAAELAKAAPQEMIDAINRSRPADQKIPYGTKLSALLEKGIVGGERVPQAVLDDLANRSVVIQQLDELSTNFGALPTGPIAGRLEAIKQRFGIDVTDEKVAYRQILQTTLNQLLQARSGAAINEHEYQRIKGELPDPDDPQAVFKTKLATATRLAKNFYKTKARTYREAGHALSDTLMEPLAAAEAPPAPKPSSNVDKFKNAIK